MLTDLNKHCGLIHFLSSIANQIDSPLSVRLSFGLKLSWEPFDNFSEICYLDTKENSTQTLIFIFVTFLFFAKKQQKMT